MVGACREHFALSLPLQPRAKPVELERAVVDRFENGTAGLACVRAVAEATRRAEGFDVLEGCTDVALPELELAQAGRVDAEPAAGQLEALTVSRRVTPGTVGRNGTRAHDLFSRQPVEQR